MVRRLNPALPAYRAEQRMAFNPRIFVLDSAQRLQINNGNNNDANGNCGPRPGFRWALILKAVSELPGARIFIPTVRRRGHLMPEPWLGSPVSRLTSTQPRSDDYHTRYGGHEYALPRMALTDAGQLSIHTAVELLAYNNHYHQSRQDFLEGSSL